MVDECTFKSFVAGDGWGGVVDTVHASSFSLVVCNFSQTVRAIKAL